MVLELPAQDVREVPLAQCLEIQNTLELVLQRQSLLDHQDK